MFKFFNKKKKGLFLLFILILSFLLYYLNLISFLGNTVTKALLPFQKGLYRLSKGLSLSQGTNYYLDESQKNKLSVLKVRLKILEEENRILKKQLGFIKKANLPQEKYVLAEIISKDFFQPALVILNKGKKDGIGLGYPIVVDEGILVGKVSKVKDHISEVSLLSSFQSKVAALVLNEKKAMGIVEGNYDLGLKMNLIPKDKKIAKDDLVITVGLEPLIPSGLLIGRITEVINHPNDLFQNAFIKPLIRYEDLKLILVLIP